MRLAAVSFAMLLGACGAARHGDAMAPATGGFVAVAGGSIHYEVAGRGETVLLIHGGFGDRRMWDAQFATLASRYRVARMDLRGYGESSFPEAPYSPVADVIAVLDRLGAARAHLVGNSMGGALAIDVALAHPERVASLTVVASGADGYPATAADQARFAGDLEGIRAVFRAAAKDGAERGVALWKAHPMVAVAHADPDTAPLLHRMIDDNRRMFALEHWPEAGAGAVHRLGAIDAPTLVVVGDRDIALVRAAAEHAAREIDGASLVTIPGTDHLPQLEQPRRFNRILLAFLERQRP